MRIIGGRFKGRKFTPPAKNWPTRPTTDFAKEGLFNTLRHLLDFESVRMLDLFGGTGNHCYEFISRGCTDATYIDKFGGCIAFVKKTAKTLGIEKELTIIRGDVLKFINRQSILKNKKQYDYIFAGPPYALPSIDRLPDLILESDLLHPDGILVLEHNPDHNFEAHPRFFQLRKYGQTFFSFFE